MSNKLSKDNLDRIFSHLADQLELIGAEVMRLVVCGGSALIATGLRQRTTNDADIVALMNDAGQLVSPDPLPSFLVDAAARVARDLGLNENWLNNGPSREEGGLFQMGLPEGFTGRLNRQDFGPYLTVYFISRLDQIHFKLYAAADQRDQTHIADLRSLNPNNAELETAARWAMTHDVSEGFRFVLRELLRDMNYASVADNI